MSQSRNITHIVTKVPAVYRNAAPRYWCNHCSDSHDSRVMIGIHYQECYPEHIGECASWEGWSKQSYQQTRHAGNESDWEGEDQGEKDVHDEESDEEDTRDEAAKGMRVGPIPRDADEESDEEYRSTQRNRKPVSAMEQARIYFNIAAHGGQGSDVLELTRRGTAKLREADAELEGQQGTEGSNENE